MRVRDALTGVRNTIDTSYTVLLPLSSVSVRSSNSTRLFSALLDARIISAVIEFLDEDSLGMLMFASRAVKALCKFEDRWLPGPSAAWAARDGVSRLQNILAVHHFRSLRAQATDLWRRIDSFVGRPLTEQRAALATAAHLAESASGRRFHPWLLASLACRDGPLAIGPYELLPCADIPAATADAGERLQRLVVDAPGRPQGCVEARGGRGGSATTLLRANLAVAVAVLRGQGSASWGSGVPSLAAGLLLLVQGGDEDGALHDAASGGSGGVFLLEGADVHWLAPHFGAWLAGALR